jgi:folate-binding Fe-S cluster repair protein YgfZ
VVPVSYQGFAPEAGMPVNAGERDVGTLGSTAQGRGLAMLRLDRVADALAAGEPLVAGGVEMRLVKPAWARFAFPGDTKAAQ